MATSRSKKSSGGPTRRAWPQELEEPAVPFVPAYDLLEDPVPTDEEAFVIGMTVYQLTRALRPIGMWNRAPQSLARRGR